MTAHHTHAGNVKTAEIIARNGEAITYSCRVCGYQWRESTDAYDRAVRAVNNERAAIEGGN